MRSVKTRVFAAAMMVASSAGLSHAAPQFVYLTESRQITAEGNAIEVGPGDFSPWDAFVDGSSSGPNQSASSSATQTSSFDPLHVRMSGRFRGDSQGTDAVASSRLLVQFQLDEPSWLELLVEGRPDGVGVAGDGTYVRLTGPTGIVEFGPGETGMDRRFWDAGLYTFDVALRFVRPQDRDNTPYRVELAIPSPGTAVLTVLAAVCGVRRRRAGVTR